MNGYASTAIVLTALIVAIAGYNIAEDSAASAALAAGADPLGVACGIHSNRIACMALADRGKN